MARTNPETQILRAVRDILRWRGWYVYRNQQGLGSHPGLPDLTAIKDGRCVQIEIKTPKGRLSEAQEKFKTEWQGRGGEYLVVRSVDGVSGL